MLLRLTRRWVPVVAVVLALAACVPSSPTGGLSSSAADASGRKVLTIAQDFEPADIQGFESRVRGRGTGSMENIIHNFLAVNDDHEVRLPQLATELPSLEKGTWRVNGDGSMDVTWKLHPNVRWHDGTPFTSADLLFTFVVAKDPALPTAAAPTLALMDSATAPDPMTFVVRWSTSYVEADGAAGLSPMPRHLLEALYERDKEAFAKADYFRTEFVGLGPYRLANWELGSHIELVRFGGYFRGRPPLDSVIVRFVLDANTMIAAALSESVDVVLRPRVDVATVLELRQRWEGTGNQAQVVSNGRIHFMEIQHRLEIARPRNAFTNRTVRQAMMHATDRQALTEAMASGFAPVADSYARPTDPWRAEVESAIVQYPYDPGRAQQLLAQAGWVRGDGVPSAGSGQALVHQPTGERFEGEIWTTPQGATSQEREAAIISSQWSQVGAKVQPYVIPAARSSDRQLQALVPTLTLSGNLPPGGWYIERPHSQNIASEENRWAGRNKLGYSNPRVDPLLETLQTTIDPRARIDLHRRLLAEETSDVTFIPLYWEVESILTLKGVRPAPRSLRLLTNFFDWSKD